MSLAHYLRLERTQLLSQEQAIDNMRKQMQVLQDQANIAILLRESSIADKMNTFSDLVANNMTVTVNTQTTGNGTLKIFDGAGKLVKQTNISVLQGGILQSFATDTCRRLLYACHRLGQGHAQTNQFREEQLI